jgi:hypothetical protein
MNLPNNSITLCCDSNPSKLFPPNLTHINCLVTPGRFLDLAIFLPNNLLIIADLPTLGNPITAARTALGCIPIIYIYIYIYINVV